MDIKVLKNRIEALKTKIEKTEKKIEKLNQRKNDENAFLKDYAWLPTFQERKDYYKQMFIDEIDSDIRRASYDLDEYKQTLDKYNKELESQLQYQSEEKVEAIWQFLLNWKSKFKDYVKEEVKNVAEYYKLNRELIKKTNNDYNYINTQEYKDAKKELNTMLNNFNPLTLKVYSPKSPTLLDETLLEKELNKEIDAKYKHLINSIKNVTGNIIDASNLSIANNGEINGIVVGEKGKAKVNTISAGGYNIQVFHYRTLVKSID